MAKRIVICCDGTWNTPESEFVTNVVKVARAVRPVAPDGVAQVVFYDWGVGTDDGGDRITGGAFGEGIDRNIRDAYRFLVHNYAPGDELFVFGFSRGAYTARSLVGFIRNCWLLRKAHAGKIPRAYRIYRSRGGPDVKPAQDFRRAYGRRIRIRFLGVWDTVGALGIPLGIFRGFNERKYSFHDTTISSIIDQACHAIAIDEKRKPFTPTIWKTRAGREHTEQAWFAGVHSDIGGGYREAGLSNLALQWMVERARRCGLGFDAAYLRTVYADERRKLHDSFTGIMRAGGKQLRRIGVTNEDEYVHRSALQRLERVNRYRPRNLLDYLASREDAVPGANTGG